MSARGTARRGRGRGRGGSSSRGPESPKYFSVFNSSKSKEKESTSESQVIELSDSDSFEAEERIIIPRVVSKTGGAAASDADKTNGKGRDSDTDEASTDRGSDDEAEKVTVGKSQGMTGSKASAKSLRKGADNGSDKSSDEEEEEESDEDEVEKATASKKTPVVKIERFTNGSNKSGVTKSSKKGNAQRRESSASGGSESDNSVDEIEKVPAQKNSKGRKNQNSSTNKRKILQKKGAAKGARGNRKRQKSVSPEKSEDEGSEEDNGKKPARTAKAAAIHRIISGSRTSSGTGSSRTSDVSDLERDSGDESTEQEEVEQEPIRVKKESTSSTSTKKLPSKSKSSLKRNVQEESCDSSDNEGGHSGISEATTVKTPAAASPIFEPRKVKQENAEAEETGTIVKKVGSLKDYFERLKSKNEELKKCKLTDGCTPNSVTATPRAPKRVVSGKSTPAAESEDDKEDSDQDAPSPKKGTGKQGKKNSSKKPAKTSTSATATVKNLSKSIAQILGKGIKGIPAPKPMIQDLKLCATDCKCPPPETWYACKDCSRVYPSLGKLEEHKKIHLTANDDEDVMIESCEEIVEDESGDDVADHNSSTDKENSKATNKHKRTLSKSRHYSSGSDEDDDDENSTVPDANPLKKQSEKVRVGKTASRRGKKRRMI